MGTDQLARLYRLHEWQVYNLFAEVENLSSNLNMRLRNLKLARETKSQPGCIPKATVKP